VQVKLLRWQDTTNHKGFRTVRENVIIAYHGTNYELGQWPQGYGIWSAGSGQSQPNEWWPATPEGWSAAWYRFVAIEVPGTIVQLSPPAAAPAAQAAPAAADQQAGPPSLQPFILPGGQPYLAGSQPAGPAEARPAAYSAAGTAYAAQAYLPPGQAYAPAAYAPAGRPQGPAGPAYGGAAPWGRPYATAQAPYGVPQDAAPSPAWRSPLAAGLLIFGLVCGVISLFPTYVGNASLASAPSDLVPHVLYLAAWTAATVLIAMGGSRLRIGALLGLGVSAVTFGLFFADLGLPIAHGAHSAGMGAGLVLGVIGWLGCAAGSLVAFGRRQAGWPGRRSGGELALAAVLIGTAIGTAITFAPSWDRYALTWTGGSQILTEGNAFLNPGPVIVGDVAVMVAVVAVLVAAALWRPARLGWALAAGAIVPLAGQLISALIQISQSPLTQLGISPAAAARVDLTATAGFTGWFWAYCAFVIAMILACGWLAARPERAVAGIMPGGPVFAGPAGTAGPAGPVTPVNVAATATQAPADGAGYPAGTATTVADTGSPGEQAPGEVPPGSSAGYPGQPQDGTASPAGG
jgi:hypothetical protein